MADETPKPDNYDPRLSDATRLWLATRDGAKPMATAQPPIFHPDQPGEPLQLVRPAKREG